MNVDMIGRLRDNKLEVYGARTAPGLRRLVSRENDAGMLLDFTWDIRGDSDHYPFFSHNVPILMLHTGKHDDYHRPSDDVEKINNEGLREITRLMVGILLAAADGPELGGFRSQSRLESDFVKRGVEVSLPPPPGRLGIRWDEQQAAAGKIVITAVTHGSAADRAGLRAGDELLTFDGRDVDDVRKFRLRVLAAKSPVSATVARRGEEEPVDVSLDLPGEPVRLGISWRTDAAEPDAVIVNRLTPGSPAAMAGIRPGDRIYAICGREFASSDEFRELARSLPDPLVLETERWGRVRIVEIPQLDDESHLTEPAGEETTPAGDES